MLNTDRILEVVGPHIGEPAKLSSVESALADLDRAEQDAKAIKRGSYLGLIQKRLAEGNIQAPRYLSRGSREAWKKLVPHISDNAQAQAALLHTLTQIDEGSE